MRSKILSKLILQAVCDTPIVGITVCVLTKDRYALYAVHQVSIYKVPLWDEVFFDLGDVASRKRGTTGVPTIHDL